MVRVCEMSFMEASSSEAHVDHGRAGKDKTSRAELAHDETVRRWARRRERDARRPTLTSGTARCTAVHDAKSLLSRALELYCLYNAV